MIAGGWSLGYNDKLASSLTHALTAKTKIDINALVTSVTIAAPLLSSLGYFSLQNTTIGATLTAVPKKSPQIGQPPPQIGRLELSRTWRESVELSILVEIRSLLSANWVSLGVFMHAYSHAIVGYVDEGAQYPIALTLLLHERPRPTTL
jgi:hypothetical protein